MSSLDPARLFITVSTQAHCGGRSQAHPVHQMPPPQSLGYPPGDRFRDLNTAKRSQRCNTQQSQTQPVFSHGQLLQSKMISTNGPVSHCTYCRLWHALSQPGSILPVPVTPWQLQWTELFSIKERTVFLLHSIPLLYNCRIKAASSMQHNSPRHTPVNPRCAKLLLLPQDGRFASPHSAHDMVAWQVALCYRLQGHGTNCRPEWAWCATSRMLWLKQTGPSSVLIEITLLSSGNQGSAQQPYRLSRPSCINGICGKTCGLFCRGRGKWGPSHLEDGRAWGGEKTQKEIHMHALRVMEMQDTLMGLLRSLVISFGCPLILQRRVNGCKETDYSLHCNKHVLCTEVLYIHRNSSKPSYANVKLFPVEIMIFFCPTSSTTEQSPE